jgi:DNA-3-methyladenine glycosylase
MLPTDTIGLARFLIGKLLVARIGGTRSVGRIVEVEAYVTGDPASHAFRGLTKRNKIMFGRRGHAYVYRIYGTSWCLNVTSAVPGLGEAVLVRALEPVAGVDAMRARRPGIADRDLLRGPGRLCAALGIDGSFDGIDMCTARSPLTLADDATILPVGISTRIGLTKGVERELRFYARGSKWLSGRVSLSP